MSAFDKLKKARSQDSVEKVQKLLNEKTQTKKTYEKDPRFWELTVEPKTQNGVALIRFLDTPPTPEGGLEEVSPWVILFTHGFKGPTGKWYIENCRSTMREKDPANDLFFELKDGTPADKALASKAKRKMNYISNILVIKDPKNPENEGKVFLFQYGRKIYEKIKLATEGVENEIETKEPFNPFDLWEGANFKLESRKVDGYRNYDLSEFLAPSPICDGDEKRMEEVYNKTYPLQPLVSSENFKSYEDLKSKLDYVLGNSTGRKSQESETVVTNDVVSSSTVETDVGGVDLSNLDIPEDIVVEDTEMNDYLQNLVDKTS